MNRETVEKIANAILYEGYMLYPHRASSIKNQQRFNFGVLYPEGFDTSLQRTECLVCGEGDATVDIEVRYLQLDETEQARERTVTIHDAPVAQLSRRALSRTDYVAEVRVSARHAAPGCFCLTVETRNMRPYRQEAARTKVLLQSMIAVHTILCVRNGNFVSLLDPPAALAEAAGQCRNLGTWPVLAGDEGSHDAMLSSPAILHDYPKIAPESPQHLFDATEIDEILTLRILTLTDAEKAEIRKGDERARALLDRAENMPPEQLMKLHGVLRGLPGKKSVRVFGIDLHQGDRVRLWPQKRADIMDIALRGRIATIESIEPDIEGNLQFAVVIDDDPGRDLGALRQPGHRFFFGPEEVEPLDLEVCETP